MNGISEGRIVLPDVETFSFATYSLTLASAHLSRLTMSCFKNQI